jgi:hypothetical protein
MRPRTAFSRTSVMTLLCKSPLHLLATLPLRILTQRTALDLAIRRYNARFSSEEW